MPTTTSCSAPTVDPDQADAHLRRAAQGARSRRGGGVRRRRFRVVRRQVHRLLRARLLARPRALRLSRHRHGLRDGGPHRPSRSTSRGDDGRRRRRLLAARRRLARAPRSAGGRDRGQQRMLGAREVPDDQALRLSRGGRAASRDPLRPASSRPSAAPARPSPKRTTLAPALARAFASGVPYLVNVITDPDDEYPRQSALG